jgi:hypothetical protein
VTSFGARSSAAATIFLGRSFRVQRRQSVRGGVERRRRGASGLKPARDPGRRETHAGRESP